MSNMVILKGPAGVRLVNCGEPYRLHPDEQIGGTASLVDAAKHTEQQSIGVGDLVAASLRTIGVEKKAGCGCKNRQQKLNRYRIKGPSWLRKWTKK